MNIGDGNYGEDEAHARAEDRRLLNEAANSGGDKDTTGATPLCDAMPKVYRYRSAASGLIYDRHDAAGDISETLIYVPMENAQALERELYEKLNDVQIAADRIDELKLRSEHWCDMHTVARQKLTDSGAWQPIETAPKDGKPFLSFTPHEMGGFNIVTSFCTDGKLRCTSDGRVLNPTHWQAMTYPVTTPVEP